MPSAGGCRRPAVAQAPAHGNQAGPHLTSRLLPRAGSKVLIVAGLVVMGSGALLLTGVSVRSGYLTGFLPGLLVVTIGTGLTLPSAAVTAMSYIAEDRAGLASGLMTAAIEIGAALGVAVFSAVAVAASGGIAAGYQHGFVVAAAVAGVLAAAAALLAPAVRPTGGMRWDAAALLKSLVAPRHGRFAEDIVVDGDSQPRRTAGRTPRR